MKKTSFYIFLIIIIILLLNTKNIGRIIYPLEYKDYILINSDTNDLEPNLIAAIINVESNFDENAISSKNAIGLMQILPETAKWIAENKEISDFNTDMLYDPAYNIKLGSWYINNLISQFESIDLALAAYNGGSGNVNNWLKDKRYSQDGVTLDSIPFKETENYIKKVKEQSDMYKFLYNF